LTYDLQYNRLPLLKIKYYFIAVQGRFSMDISHCSFFETPRRQHLSVTEGYT